MSRPVRVIMRIILSMTIMCTNWMAKHTQTVLKKQYISDQLTNTYHGGI